MASKVLIVYYSWSGHTATLAKYLQQATDADLLALRVPEQTFRQICMTPLVGQNTK